ncbi:MAG: hypothetical protein ACR2QU_09555, partial [Gammaproteobacteria bacterium]
MALVDVQSQRQPLQWIGGAYRSSSLPISAQEAVNVYPEIGKEATNVIAIRGVPGTEAIVQLEAPIRGMLFAFGTMYVVGGSKVYTVSAGGIAVEIGTVANDTKPVDIENGIFGLMIISGTKGYLVNKDTNAVTEITDPDFPITDRSGWLDGYGLLIEKGTGRFWYTEINDFGSVDGLSFATAEGAPDDLISMIVD